MRSVVDHRSAVLGLLAPLAERLSAEAVPADAASLAEAPAEHVGRILAEDVASIVELPPFDNSQMDGYAVRAAELAGASDANPVSLPVTTPIAAGDPPSSLAAGWAAPIMTGAPVPYGADAVVPVEHTLPAHFPGEDEPGAERGFPAPVAARVFVRRRGGDLPAGSPLIERGTRLDPAHWGVAVAAGLASLPVRRRVRVLLCSTGHELRSPGEELVPGQIYDANGTALAAALAEAGAQVRTRLVVDRVERLRGALAEDPDWPDLVVTTGGVSAGSFEVVRESLEPQGVEFVSLALQPGGPQGLGAVSLAGPGGGPEVPVVCFPGNPVSALCSFELFLRPVLRELAGLRPAERASASLPLSGSISSPEHKHQVRRGRIRDDGRVEIVGGPGSHLLHAYTRANALVHVPVGVARVEEGTPLEVWRIDG